ncbi:hypothetical protein KXQ82_06665 [Mucilaginibacter sp. HMF5004]|uniref:hypothetical protein n=1 Tax=Mucilaginibacter rivuli TaxID=2857527 RepID=UPI001C5FA12F|nr:hypothetical protein [Mucilaginibacter rivuli]MBW4889388.1 hypothetical protein [Mucilaginibacter rivuli]
MKKILSIMVLTAICKIACAQVVKDSVRISDMNNAKTASRSEVLSNLFVALTSSSSQSDGEISFKATPFGIASIFDKSWKSDKNYIKYKTLRNIELNTALTPVENSLTQFKQGSLGLTIGLINKSDKTLANYFAIGDVFADFAAKRNIATSKAIAQFVPGSDKQIEKLIKINASIAKFFESKDANDLDADFSKELQILIGGGSVKNYALTADERVKKLMREVSNGSLVTFTPNIKYNLQKGMAEAITYKADWQFGIVNSIEKKPCMVEFSGTLKTERDTLNTTANLSHVSATGTGGMNFVLRQDEKQKSTLELKPYFEYTRVFQSKYEKEDVDGYKANLTLRLRLTDDTWLPLTVKVDLVKPKLLGFLTIFWIVK